MKTLKQWQAIVERESGYQVVHYQCDNAKEYKKFIESVKAEGIQVEDTSTYIPEQNGVAERYNQTVVQMMRSMLTWSKLPHLFWAEAVWTANYLRNRVPSSCSTDGKSPEKL